MSHEGKMRRGELSKDADNIDRIYFLKERHEIKIEKVKDDPTLKETEEIIKKVKKEKKDGGN